MSYSLTHPAVPTTTSNGTVTFSTDHPSEDQIEPSTYHSTASGFEPKSLNLPSIHTQGFIQKVGVDQHSQIAVPTNIHLAGWFVNTVTPGSLGLSIIDGHLDGYRLPGIFADIAKLKPGDSIVVELANGLTRKFRVVRVQSLPTSQAVSVLFSQTPGISRQLNLITCGGVFNKSAGYDHRVIVMASLLN